LRNFLGKCATKRRLWVLTGIALACATGIVGCEPTEENDIGALEKEAAADEMCGENGRLQAKLYGSLTASLDWTAADFECSGMPRPGGSGARLHFGGTAADDHQSIVIIIAIPDLQRDKVGAELRSNVTVIEEESGRFFSTPDLDNCLTDITSMSAIEGTPNQYSIGGVLYCLSPIPELNSKSSVTISDVEFTGLIDWGNL